MTKDLLNTIIDLLHDYANAAVDHSIGTEEYRNHIDEVYKAALDHKNTELDWLEDFFKEYTNE